MVDVKKYMYLENATDKLRKIFLIANPVRERKDCLLPLPLVPKAVILRMKD